MSKITLENANKIIDAFISVFPAPLSLPPSQDSKWDSLRTALMNPKDSTLLQDPTLPQDSTKSQDPTNRDIYNILKAHFFVTLQSELKLGGKSCEENQRWSRELDSLATLLCYADKTMTIWLIADQGNAFALEVQKRAEQIKELAAEYAKTQTGWGVPEEVSVLSDSVEVPGSPSSTPPAPQAEKPKKTEEERIALTNAVSIIDAFVRVYNAKHSQGPQLRSSQHPCWVEFQEALKIVLTSSTSMKAISEAIVQHRESFQYMSGSPKQSSTETLASLDEIAEIAKIFWGQDFEKNQMPINDRGQALVERMKKEAEKWPLPTTSEAAASGTPEPRVSRLGEKKASWVIEAIRRAYKATTGINLEVGAFDTFKQGLNQVDDTEIAVKTYIEQNAQSLPAPLTGHAEKVKQYLVLADGGIVIGKQIDEQNLREAQSDEVINQEREDLLISAITRVLQEQLTTEEQRILGLPEGWTNVSDNCWKPLCRKMHSQEFQFTEAGLYLWLSGGLEIITNIVLASSQDSKKKLFQDGKLIRIF